MLSSLISAGRYLLCLYKSIVEQCNCSASYYPKHSNSVYENDCANVFCVIIHQYCGTSTWKGCTKIAKGQFQCLNWLLGEPICLLILFLGVGGGSNWRMSSMWCYPINDRYVLGKLHVVIDLMLYAEYTLANNTLPSYTPTYVGRSSLAAIIRDMIGIGSPFSALRMYSALKRFLLFHVCHLCHNRISYHYIRIQ